MVEKAIGERHTEIATLVGAIFQRRFAMVGSLMVTLCYCLAQRPIAPPISIVDH